MLKSLGLVQISVLIIVAVLFMMTWDFGRRILENVQLVQAAQIASAELAHANRVNTQLKQLKKDVITDDWVTKKARVDLHYAREDETLFIPATTPSAPSAPAPPTVPTHAARPAWQDWLEALFGPLR
ncbi:MAG: hypothetical protein IT331_11495 [Anaerolineae bacterium]|nr:hypothetical protein [Anaerolineae bacterium]